MPKTSIIIPAYNQARFLAQAIESALGQSDADVEVIVVDDGSTDDTPQVLGQFTGRPGFKAVRQANAGLPATRNRGAREAAGNYLCFLDSDDWFDPAKVHRQAALLDANPELGFVYCDILTVDEGGQPVAEQFSVADTGRELSGDIFPSLMLGGYFPPHTVLLRRSVFESAGGFDPELGGHADYDLWLRVAALHRAGYVPERLACYRTYDTSMSKDGLHMTETRLATLRKISRLYPERTGDAIHALQQLNQDLHQANQWLNQNWTEVLSRVELGDDSSQNGREHYSLLRNFDQARLVRGRPDQLAVWEASLDGLTTKAVCLHAPAEMIFAIPMGCRGQFSTAVCLHPDAWIKPGCGGCEFHLRIDGRLASVIALDPVNLAADRHWHEIRIDVPESANGQHAITFETRAIGANADYRWALWRNPKFSWIATPAAPLENTPPSTLRTAA